MTKEQLKRWLDKQDKRFTPVILVCPRCHKVDINPNKHLDECDPLGEQQRREAQDYYD